MEQGRLLLFTGDGKGKSTAAFGLAARARGHGQKVCVIQFIKSEDFETGELLFFKNVGVEFIPCGCGFTWQKSAKKNREGIRRGFELALEKLKDETYDLIVLDELCCVLTITGFETDDVCPLDILLDAINEAKKNKHIAVTGRGAPQKLKDAADLVTEMKPVKHYYNDGIAAEKGLEY